MEERRYIKIVLCLTLLIAVVAGALNYAANPLGIYNTPVIHGFNDVHPAADAYARLVKIEGVKRVRPDAIILGTSRADSGFDPKPEFFPGMTPYNFAAPSASMLEQRRMLEFAEAAHPLKEAVITLDFFVFNALKLENKAFEPGRLSPEALSPPRAFFDTYGTLLALDTLVATMKHLRYLKHLEQYDEILPDGRTVSSGKAWRIGKEGAAKQFLHPENEAEVSFDGFSFAYSKTPGDTTFQHVEAMLDFARRHKIKVVLVIPPVHESYLRSIEKTGKGAMMDEWKARLADIDRANAARFGAKPYPLWDFSARGSFTTEPIPAESDKATQMKWFWDSNHFKPALGDIVLRKALGLPGGAQYPDFGTKLVE